MNVVMKTDTKLYSVLQNDINGSDKKLMLSLIKYMTKDMNTITINGDTLSSIIKDTGMSESHIRNALSNLSRLELVEPTRLLRSEYIVNPVLCYKGNEDTTWRYYSYMENQRKAKYS